jgi:hypothetical protein
MREVAFDELLEIPQILAEGAGQDYRLDNRPNFDGHSRPAVRKWIENDHANAKMFGRSLPGNPTIGHAHHDQNVAFDFFALDVRCAGKAVGAEVVDLSDGCEKAGKIFKA